jgi:hypothetical protein
MVAGAVYRGGAAEADATTDDLAVLDLAASALFDDRGLMGPSLVLLAGRSCSASCAPVGRGRLAE